MKDKKDRLVIFQNKKIRRIWHQNEWFFSVIDIIGVLIGGERPRKYWSDLKKKLIDEGYFQASENIGQLKLEASDGKMRKTDCANTETFFRIIQSISSPKAEPFKRWLARVGKERVDEIENPELAQERMKKLYEEKGYSKDWIDKRLRGMAIRQNLTDEWKDRGVINQKDYAILTTEISRATFGMNPSEYRKFKNIPDKSKANLRDNMDDFELIFTMLGEKVTTEISQKEKPKGMLRHRKVANRGGSVARKARKETEKEIGRAVSSRKNFLNLNLNKHIKN